MENLYFIDNPEFDTFQKVNNAPKSGKKKQKHISFWDFLVTIKTTLLFNFFPNIAFGAYSNDGRDLHAGKSVIIGNICMYSLPVYITFLG